MSSHSKKNSTKCRRKSSKNWWEKSSTKMVGYFGKMVEYILQEKKLEKKVDRNIEFRSLFILLRWFLSFRVNNSALSDDLRSEGRLFQNLIDWYMNENWHLDLLNKSGIKFSVYRKSCIVLMIRLKRCYETWKISSYICIHFLIQLDNGKIHIRLFVYIQNTSDH